MFVSGTNLHSLNLVKPKIPVNKVRLKVQTYYACPRADVSRLAVRRWAGKQKDLGSIRFASPFFFSSKIVVYGHCLVTLPTQLMKH